MKSHNVIYHTLTWVGTIYEILYGREDGTVRSESLQPSCSLITRYLWLFGMNLISQNMSFIVAGIKEFFKRIFFKEHCSYVGTEDQILFSMVLFLNSVLEIDMNISSELIYVSKTTPFTHINLD